MTHWTYEDSLKALLVGAVSLGFLLIGGPALAERLGLRPSAPEIAAAAGRDQADADRDAHRQALELEQRYPMIDVLGYGHGIAKGKEMTYVVFGVADQTAVRSREPEAALALMQLAGQLAEADSQSLIVVHFSLREGVVTGEFNCPRAEYDTYEQMDQGGCVAAVYSPEERSALPEAMTRWVGVGK